MARFTYNCPDHGDFSMILVRREKSVGCPECGNQSKPVYKPTAGVTVVERLDNGLMAKTVERIHNIEEMLHDRADKHSEENSLHKKYNKFIEEENDKV